MAYFFPDQAEEKNRESLYAEGERNEISKTNTGLSLKMKISLQVRQSVYRP